MPRPPIDLNRKIRDILQHTEPLLPLADLPLRHFEGSVNSGFALLRYIDSHIDDEAVFQAVYDRHLAHLRRMILAEIIESFERFLKELAAACVDFLAPYTTDDRFDDLFPKRGEKLAGFLNAPTVGKALCESDTWLSNAIINTRFSSLLKLPTGDWESLFPNVRQQPASERARAETLSILWQIRHNLAHNLGVLTHSDSMKFRLLIKGPLPQGQCLFPSDEDLRYVKRFLLATATSANERIGNRLALILSDLHASDPTLFDALDKANAISRQFTFSVTVNGTIGTP